MRSVRCVLSMMLIFAAVPSFAAPSVNRTKDQAVRIEEALRLTGFAQAGASASGWVSSIGRGLDMDGDGRDEMITSEDLGESFIRLTARKNGVPLWSRMVHRYTWLRSIGDVDGDAGKDLLVYDAYDESGNLIVSAGQAGIVASVVSGATGKDLWSIQTRGIGGNVVVAHQWIVIRPFYVAPIADATGDGRTDVLDIGGGLVNYVLGSQVVCLRDGVTGRVVGSCITFASDDWLMVAPLPDLNGDARADILVNATYKGNRHLFAFNAIGGTIWKHAVDQSWALRWPVPNFDPGGAGELLFGPACTFLGCHGRRTDALDSRTGLHVWERDISGGLIGDVDGDGRSDIASRSSDDDGDPSFTIYSSSTGQMIRTWGPFPSTPRVGYSMSQHFGPWEDFDRDGITDFGVVTQYWRNGPEPDYYTHSLVFSGRTGATIWERDRMPWSVHLIMPNVPALDSIPSDVTGDDVADFMYTEVMEIPGQTNVRWNAHFIDGATGSPLWSAGPVIGNVWYGIVPGNFDGARGDEIAVLWFVRNGESNGPQHITAFGPTGRLWSVTLTGADVITDP